MSLLLGDPLFEEEAPRSARCSTGKVLAAASVFIGCLLLSNSGMGPQLAEEPLNAVAMPMRSVNMRTARSPAQFGAPSNLLKSYGIGSSPIEKLALEAIGVANRCGSGDLRDLRAMAAKMPQDVQDQVATAERAVVRMSAEGLKSETPLKPTDLAGITVPMGFFDPVGFTSDIPAGTLLFYREVELKHGRVGMLASLGILVAEKFHPLFGGDIDVPAAFAFQQTPLQSFWPAVLALIGVCEISSILSFDQPFDKFSGYAIKKGWSIKEGRLPGDLGFDPLGFLNPPPPPERFLEIQNKELNNGRLAMLATAGMIAQELVTGQKLFP
jgi:hypothetical protein